MIALVPITRIWIIRVNSIFYLPNPKRVKTYAYFLGSWVSNWQKKSALVQVMAWRRTGDKPLPKPMLTQLADTYMRH